MATEDQQVLTAEDRHEIIVRAKEEVTFAKGVFAFARSTLVDRSFLVVLFVNQDCAAFNPETNRVKGLGAADE